MDVLDKKSGAVILIDGRSAGRGGSLVLLEITTSLYYYVQKSLGDETSSLYWTLYMYM